MVTIHDHPKHLRRQLVGARHNPNFHQHMAKTHRLLHRHHPHHPHHCHHHNFHLHHHVNPPPNHCNFYQLSQDGTCQKGVKKDITHIIIMSIIIISIIIVLVLVIITTVFANFYMAHLSF